MSLETSTTKTIFPITDFNFSFAVQCVVMPCVILIRKDFVNKDQSRPRVLQHVFMGTAFPLIDPQNLFAMDYIQSSICVDCVAIWLCFLVWLLQYTLNCIVMQSPLQTFSCTSVLSAFRGFMVTGQLTYYCLNTFGRCSGTGDVLRWQRQYWTSSLLWC